MIVLLLILNPQCSGLVFWKMIFIVLIEKSLGCAMISLSMPIFP